MIQSQSKWGLYRSNLGAYMSRWIARCPWGTLRIHHIMKSDEGRDHHDHPFSFFSLIVKGRYLEHVPGCRCYWDERKGRHYLDVFGPCRIFKAGSILRRPATALHRLELIDGPVWTFVITGPYKRMWGFLTAKGWVPFHEYQRSFYKP